VDEGYVDGWNDPRMPTISGMRRRGYTPSAIRQFCDMIGVTRADSLVDVSMLEFALRDDLNEHAPRAMCVLRPLRLSISNFGESGLSDGDFVNVPVHPNKPEMGERQLPYGAELFIDQTDFSEDTTLSRKKFKRLVIGDYVRLRGGHIIRADEVIKNPEGEIVEIKASLVPNTIGENPPEGIRPRGVIHWVSAGNSLECQLRMHDRLFTDPTPDSGDKNFLDYINPESLIILEGCRAEISLNNAAIGHAYQFEREGYFCLDSKHSTKDRPIFNQTIGLKDNWQGKDKV
jgi:glutaminyl-tRNA synthetase